MRERSYKVDTEKLQALSRVYKPSRIAKQLNVSRQRWHMWQSGDNDVPESMLDLICQEFRIEKHELALE